MHQINTHIDSQKELKFMRKTAKMTKIMATDSDDDQEESDSIYTSFIESKDNLPDKSIEEESFEFESNRRLL